MLQSEHGINIVGSSVGSRSWISAGADIPAQFGWAIARQKLMRMFSVIRDHDAGGFCWIGEASLIEDPILVTEMCRKGGSVKEAGKELEQEDFNEVLHIFRGEVYSPRPAVRNKSDLTLLQKSRLVNLIFIL